MTRYLACVSLAVLLAATSSGCKGKQSQSAKEADKPRAARVEPAAFGVGSKAPDFPKDAIWLGSGPHSFATDLKGKVVLVDFWEYTCINCIRTFPHLKQIYDRYHKDGFEIIGVQKGEFAFASDPDKIKQAYERFKLPYPGIADVKSTIWGIYQCDTWPESFLVGRDGTIREVHKAEGDYGQLELKVQELLKEGHPELGFSNIVVTPDKPLFGPDCGEQSEEIYVGSERGGQWGGQIANGEGFQPGKVVDYESTDKRVQRGFYVEGKWLNHPDDFESVAPSTPQSPVSLGITYKGRDVYSVLDRTPDKPVELTVTRDGQPVPADRRGVDVKADADGQTYVTIDESRMYYIITKEDDGTHDLRFYPRSAGARICSFTFGNKCLADFDRL